jgi:hypothetical protein
MDTTTRAKLSCSARAKGWCRSKERKREQMAGTRPTGWSSIAAVRGGWLLHICTVISIDPSTEMRARLYCGSKGLFGCIENNGFLKKLVEVFGD